jgi:hypothetical protein
MAALGIGAIAVACGSFSGDEASAEDGGTEATTPDGHVVDSEVDEANAPSCIPQPLDPTDAGEDASCEPNSAPIDLGTSTTHCGRCRHECTGSVCQNGRCVPVVASSEGSPATLGSVASGRIYFSTAGSPRHVRSFGTDSMTAQTHADLADDAGGLGAPLVDGVDAFAVASDLGIIDVDTSSMSPNVKTFFARSGNALTAIAVDSSTVYALDYTGTIVGLPRDGGGAVPILPGNTGTVIGMVSDHTKLYWSLKPTGAGPDSTKLQIRDGNGTVVNRAESLPDVAAITLDRDYVYLAGPDGVVRRIEKTGTSAPAIIARLPGQRLYPKGFAVDDDNVYVACTDDALGGTVQLSIFEAPKCGGPVRLVATDFMYTPGLAVVGRFLYWSRDSSIARVAK